MKPLIAIITAMADHQVIGAKGGMPWHLPADLQYFKQITLGKPIIMGRRTFASIGRALPHRDNIIISQQAHLTLPGCNVVNSVDAALARAKHLLHQTNEINEIMVIGGAKIYQQTLHLADKLYLTRIHHEFKGDTYFPEWSSKDWREISRVDHPADEKNPYPYSFITLQRLKH